MEFDPIKYAQSRTRPQWVALWKTKFEELRTKVRSGGDKAMIGSFVAGIALVLFFKIVVVIALLAGTIGYGIYFMAPEEPGPYPPKDHSNS
jgi:hypothetical protein